MHPISEQWKLHIAQLRSVAEAQGVSHAEIAERTGLHRSNVTRFFGQKNCPNLDTFLRVAKALDLDVDFSDRRTEPTTEL